MKNTSSSRRNFITNGLLAGSLLPLAPAFSQNLFQENPVVHSPVDEGFMPEFHVFSKHLQFLDYQTMARFAKRVGFDGVELSVRPGGHVEPENVARDLPLAVKALREEGLKADLMTTAITDADNKISQQVVASASSLGITGYRMGYFDYLKDRSIPESIVHFQTVCKNLAKLNKKHKITGYYQNHSGLKMGASVWELYNILEKANQEYIGAQFDIRHAMVEGGQNWKNAVKLIAPLIKSVVLKDYIWSKSKDKWILVNVPLGEGMVNFTEYFKILKSMDIQVPITLHYEYNLGGAEHGKRELSIDHTLVFNAMKQDLDYAKRVWREAAKTS